MPVPVPRLSAPQILAWFANLPKQDFADQKILLVVPGAPVDPGLPTVFDALFHEIRPICFALDVLVASGARPPLSDPQISNLLGIDETERRRLFYQMQFFNHEWDRPERLITLGMLAKTDTVTISHQPIANEVPVEINSRVLDYDLLLVLGPVYPDEFLGYSGGNEYLFPGIAGPGMLNFLDDLRNPSTNRGIPGTKDSPGRRAIDMASSMISLPKRAITFVTSPEGGIDRLFYGKPESAWNDAADFLNPDCPKPSAGP